MSFFDQNHSSVITDHIAWHGKINQFMSELFLYAHKPMSYILWQSRQDLHYFFSYVVDIFTIYHRMFFFDPNSFIWIYVGESITHRDKDLCKILRTIMQVHPTNHWQPIIHASTKPISLLNSQKRIRMK